MKKAVVIIALLLAFSASGVFSQEAEEQDEGSLATDSGAPVEEDWREINLSDPNRPVIITLPYNVVTGLNPQRPEYRDEAAQCYDMALIELQFQGTVYGVYGTHTVDNLTTPPSWAQIPAGVDPKYILTYDIQRFPGGEPGERIFEITAWALDDNHNPFQFVSVSTAYTERRQVLDAIPHLVWQITSVFPANTRDIPMPEDEDYRWKHKWLYLGLLTGGSARFFQLKEDGQFRNDPAIGWSFDVGARLEFQFISYWWPKNYFSVSILTGATFDNDGVNYVDVNSPPTIAGSFLNRVNIPLKAQTISIPLGVKFNLKPKNIALGLYAQAYYILPINVYEKNKENPFSLGWRAGFEGGTHLGPGVLFVDIAVSSDLTGSFFDYNGTPQEYKRTWVTLSVGYTFGLITKPIKERAIPSMRMKYFDEVDSNF
ncbi:MAG: hypothetical protein LBT16_02515 [Treponema sp.]|nr:hypothetical protein [Treponema sp.]